MSVEDKPDIVPQDSNQAPSELNKSCEVIETKIDGILIESTDCCESTTVVDSSSDDSDDNECTDVQLSDVIAEIQSIKNEIDSLHKSNEKYMSRKETIDALKRSFEDALKTQEQRKNLSSMRMAASMHERFGQLCAACNAESDNLTIDGVIKSFGNFIIELENLLIAFGIDHYDDVGKVVDPTRDEVVGIRMTDDFSLDKVIEGSSGFGYIAEGWIQKQKVYVYKYKGAE